MSRPIAELLWTAALALIYLIAAAYALAYYEMNLWIGSGIFERLAKQPLMELVIAYAACFVFAWFQVRRWYAKAMDYEADLAEDAARRRKQANSN
jgi:hypothetical protein